MKHLTMLTLILISIFTFVVLMEIGIFNFRIPSQNSHDSINLTSASNASVIYIGYSPTCPHCHHLLEYIDSLNVEGIKILSTTNGRYIYDCLSKHGIRWDFGVPIMFAWFDSKLFVIQGFPSSSQDSEGYFLGKEKEIEYCKSSNGKLNYDENGRYLFCTLPNGIVLGNRNAVDYLLKKCKETACKAICP